MPSVGVFSQSIYKDFRKSEIYRYQVLALHVNNCIAIIYDLSSLFELFFNGF